MSVEDQIAFIEAMCRTGESDRYGQRTHEQAGEEFANLVAEHAQRQFEDGRALLAQAKHSLTQYARSTLRDQVSEAVGEEWLSSVKTNFSGVYV